MNLTDNDIKIVLELLHKRILHSKIAEEVTEAEIIALVEVVDLINRQKAEIERLTNKLEQREEMMANLGVEFTTIQGTANYYKMHYEKAQAEIERLYIEGLQINKTFMDFVNKQIAEAIKEFAERLKNCFAISGDYLDIINIIDNLVKEFVERKVNL